MVFPVMPGSCSTTSMHTFTHALLRQRRASHRAEQGNWFSIWVTLENRNKGRGWVERKDLSIGSQGQFTRATLGAVGDREGPPSFMNISAVLFPPSSSS